MTPTPQTTFGLQGNCMAACLASILDKPLQDIPDFIGILENVPDNERHIVFHDAIDDYLDSIGYERTFHPYSTAYNRFSGVDEYYIVTGTSPRGYSHAVVYCNGKPYHDPHPDGTFLTEITGIQYILPVVTELGDYYPE